MIYKYFYFLLSNRYSSIIRIKTIESNKVRNQVAKYLIRKGCTRVQRSIFLADLANSEYNSIRQDLAEVQAAYDNKDSILIVPISTDYLQSMKIIGQKIELDIIMHNKNTLFFWFIKIFWFKKQINCLFMVFISKLFLPLCPVKKEKLY